MRGNISNALESNSSTVLNAFKVKEELKRLQGSERKQGGDRITQQLNLYAVLRVVTLTSKACQPSCRNNGQGLLKAETGLLLK